MANHKLSLRTIEKLDDGRIAAAFKIALQRAIRDCENRPANRKSRKVMLQVEVLPHLNDDGRCYDCDFSFAIKESLPQANSAKYRGCIKHDGSLLFNDLSDDNPNQLTLDDGNDSFADDDESEDDA